MKPDLLDIRQIMHVLAENRPLFHSEADFQHAFAWTIQELLPTAQLRLERPVLVDGKRMHIDLWVEIQGQVALVELKYLKRATNITWKGETYSMAGGAGDIDRYDYLKDIVRLERMIAERVAVIGYALLLTNDSSYWTVRTGTSTFEAFRVHEGVVLKGELPWAGQPALSTTQGRESPHALARQYVCRWTDYSMVTEKPGGRFRYLSLSVSGAQ